MPSPRLGTDPNPGQCRAIVGQARPPEISSPDECGVPVLREGCLMTPTTDKITHQLAPRLAPLDLLTTMRRRNTALSCKNRWAQQGSNLRPLACKASALPLSYAPVQPLRARRAPGGNPAQRTSRRVARQPVPGLAAGPAIGPMRWTMARLAGHIVA